MASPGKKSFLLRVDPALWDVVEQLAAQELRSTNAQVEYLLREALARRGRMPKRGPSTGATSAVSADMAASPARTDRPDGKGAED
jgi:hypothetical protein